MTYLHPKFEKKLLKRNNKKTKIKFEFSLVKVFVFIFSYVRLVQLPELDTTANINISNNFILRLFVSVLFLFFCNISE